jgi:hypothetical protein
MFAAYKQRIKYFKKQDLTSVIPATEKFSANEAGKWFVNRCEVREGTEVLIEYRQRETRGFGERIEYMLLIAEETAPLIRMRITLPEHPLSAVPYLFYEGRMTVITSDDLLPDASQELWRNKLSLSDEYQISDILDPQQEPDDQMFRIQQLEAGVRASKKATVIVDKRGGKRVKIRRSRNIKV